MSGPFLDLQNLTLNFSFFVTVFGAGILGSAHCAGMCGPLACHVSKNRIQNLIYNMGRLIGYLIVGGIFGYLGEILMDHEISWLRYLGTSFMLIFIGFSTWATLKGRPFSFYFPTTFKKPILSVLNKVGMNWRAFFMGLLTFTLPCGWLMTFGAVAAATGSILGGMATMTSFWLSTLPVMTILPMTGARILRPLVGKHPLTATLLLCSMSLFVIGIRFFTSHCH